MQLNSLRATSLLSLSLGILLAPACAQSGPHKSSAVLPGSGAKPDDVSGLPPFLLQVPKGTVEMGLDSDEFVAAIAQATFPMKPGKAHEIAEKQFIRGLRRSVSVLGRQAIDVPTFLLGKWPVKNSEYKIYVDKLRAAKQDVRPPFHWWRYGCEADYNERLPEIRKAFPKNPDAVILYWERHGHELPYKLQDRKGNSIADLPVTYISWRDANRFAATIGMRLPREAELTRAMRGNGTHTWPLGEQQDVYTNELLKQLKMSKTSEYVAKPVGTVTAATGPFGHLDMFGQVWQLCADVGFEPIHGIDAFQAPWKRLLKNKVGRLIGDKPGWHVDRAIAKGGSYLSYQEPVQLLIDARAPVSTGAVLESLGLRLAKSLKPGYDYLYSLQRVRFSRDPFAKDQDLDLSAQVGAERYTLAANGFPSAYEAVSFTPVNWLSDEKRPTLRELIPATQEQPIIIGGLATTAKFQNGTEPGLYAVLYRNMGIPKKLSDAVKRGHKEIVKARKAAAKAAKNKKKDDKKAEKDDKKRDDKKADKKDDKKKANDWRVIIKQYGLTEDDIADVAAADGNLGWVRIDSVTVPTDRDAFLLSEEGKVVSVLPGTNRKPTTGKPFESTLVIEAGAKAAKANAVAKFRFGVPLQANKPKRVVVFELHAVLDQEAPTEASPWRLPRVK